MDDQNSSSNRAPLMITILQPKRGFIRGMLVKSALSVILVALAVVCPSSVAYNPIPRLTVARSTSLFASPTESAPESKNEVINEAVVVSDESVVTAVEKKQDISVVEEAKAMKTVPSKASNSVAPLIEGELLAATTIGGIILGIALGTLADLNLFDGDVPFYVAPLVLGSILGGGSYYATTQPEASSYATAYLGKPTLAVRDKVVENAQESVDSAKKAVNKKIYDTVTDIKKIPDTIKDSINKKIDETVLSIKSIPENVKLAILKAVDDTKASIKKKIESIISDIRAIPSNLKKTAAKQADIIIGEVQAIPGSTAKAITKAADDAKLAAKKKTEVFEVPFFR